MLTLDDLNNVVAFMLKEGPLTPVEIRQFLDRLAEENRLPIDLIDTINNSNINGRRILRHTDRVIDPNLYPPMNVVTSEIQRWERENPGMVGVVHLFFSPNTPLRLREDLRRTWMDEHPGREEVISHEFQAGDPDLLTEEQRQEVRRILTLLNGER